MFVGDEEVTLVFVLKGQPVLDAADVMAEVKAACWRVAGENADLEAYSEQIL